MHDKIQYIRGFSESLELTLSSANFSITLEIFFSGGLKILGKLLHFTMQIMFCKVQAMKLMQMQLFHSIII